MAGWGPPAPPEPGQHRVFSLTPWAGRGRHGRGGSGGSLAGRLFLRFWRRMCARRALPHFSPPPVSFRVKKGELTLLCAADLSMVTTGFQKPEQRFGSMENNNFSKFPPTPCRGCPSPPLAMFPRAFSCPGPGFSAGFHHLESQMGSATLRASPGGTCNPSHPHREPGGASCHIPEGAEPSGHGHWGPALPSCRGAAALSIPASCRQREPARHHPCAAAADGCDIFLEGLGGSDGDVLMLSVPVRSLLMGREQPAGCHMPPSPCCWWKRHRRAPSAVTRLQHVPG